MIRNHPPWEYTIFSFEVHGNETPKKATGRERLRQNDRSAHHFFKDSEGWWPPGWRKWLLSNPKVLWTTAPILEIARYIKWNQSITINLLYHTISDYIICNGTEWIVMWCMDTSRRCIHKPSRWTDRIVRIFGMAFFGRDLPKIFGLPSN